MTNFVSTVFCIFISNTLHTYVLLSTCRNSAGNLIHEGQTHNWMILWYSTPENAAARPQPPAPSLPVANAPATPTCGRCNAATPKRQGTPAAALSPCHCQPKSTLTTQWHGTPPPPSLPGIDANADTEASGAIVNDASWAGHFLNPKFKKRETTEIKKADI